MSAEQEAKLFPVGSKAKPVTASVWPVGQKTENMKQQTHNKLQDQASFGRSGDSLDNVEAI